MAIRIVSAVAGWISRDFYAIVGWVIFLVLLAATGASFMNLWPIWLPIIEGFDAVVWGVIAIIYAVNEFEEVKYPNIGVLYSRGKLVGVITPGWFMGIPFLCHCKNIERKKFRIDIEQEMQVPSGIRESLTKATLRFIMDVVLGDTKEAVEKAMLLEAFDRDVGQFNKTELDEFFQEILASEAREYAGRANSFFQLLQQQKTWQKEMLVDLKEKITEMSGFEVERAELSGIAEDTYARAGEMHVVAEGMHAQAEAVSIPLKDNIPAAAVIMADNAIDTIFGPKKEKKEPKNTKEAQQQVAQEGALGAILEGIRKLVERQGGGSQ